MPDKSKKTSVDKTVTFPVEMPLSMRQALQTKRKRTGQIPSAIARKALEKWLEEKEQDD